VCDGPVPTRASHGQAIPLPSYCRDVGLNPAVHPARISGSERALSRKRMKKQPACGSMPPLFSAAAVFAALVLCRLAQSGEHRSFASLEFMGRTVLVYPTTMYSNIHCWL